MTQALNDPTSVPIFSGITLLVGAYYLPKRLHVTQAQHEQSNAPMAAFALIAPAGFILERR